MGLKHHTIIFVPHSRARFKKFRVTNRQLKIAGTTLALLTVGAIFITWSFFATSVNLDELDRLRAENEQLRVLNGTFESSLEDLQTQLTDYEDRTDELAIVAGLADVPRAAERSGTSETGAGGNEVQSYLTRDLELLARRAGTLDEKLESVEGKLEKRSQWIAATPSILPVRGVFTSRYGFRKDPITRQRAFHNGVDISAPKGTPVHAAADGIVTRSDRLGSLGRAVYVAHGYDLATRYGHLSESTVEEGQEVKRGDVIGYVGNTGRATGYHLHYEVRQGNKALNPVGYMLDLPQRRRR